MLADPKQFAKLLRRLHRQDWYVYAKSAFGGPMQLLRYLGRYTHRVAISNHRLFAFDGERGALDAAIGFGARGHGGDIGADPNPVPFPVRKTLHLIHPPIARNCRCMGDPSS